MRWPDLSFTVAELEVTKSAESLTPPTHELQAKEQANATYLKRLGTPEDMVSTCIVCDQHLLTSQAFCLALLACNSLGVLELRIRLTIQTQRPVNLLMPPTQAAAVAYLGSFDASYVTGETLVVAGGMPSKL